MDRVCTARRTKNISGLFTDLLFLQIICSLGYKTHSDSHHHLFLIETKLSVPLCALLLGFESGVNEVLFQESGKTSPASPRFTPFSKLLFPSACTSATRELLDTILSVIESSMWYTATQFQSHRISNTRKTHSKGHDQVPQRHTRCFHDSRRGNILSWFGFHSSRICVLYRRLLRPLSQRSDQKFR